MTKYLPLNKLIPLMLIYSMVTIIGMYHHELWLDDVQHWLLARDSRSFMDLIHKSAYDDHVPLWKFSLFFLTHFISDSPLAIQVLHIIIINIAVFVFLRYAPFNLAAKILILFGYYFVFEYSILCRNYALSILFLFIACTLLSEPGKNLMKIGILLVLMCSTHEFFGFAAVGIFLYLLFYNYERKSLNRRFLAFTIIFLAGLMIPVIHVLTMPADIDDLQLIKPAWLSVHNVSFAIHGIDKGFIPFPPLHDPNLWNRHFFETWSSFIKVPVSLLFLAYPVWVLRNSRKALIFYTSASFFLLLFLTLSQMSSSRQFGMFFIYFITAIWLTDYDGVNVLFINIDQRKQAIDVAAIGLFYIILATQVLAGAFIYEQDYTRPFSQGKNTVKFIREQHLDNLPIVVDGYNWGSPPLSAYIGRPIYYLGIDTTGSYYTGRNTLYQISRETLIREITKSKYLPALKEFIFISNSDSCDSETRNIPGFSFNKLNSFQNAIISSENYCVYRVAKE